MIRQETVLFLYTQQFADCKHLIFHGAIITLELKISDVPGRLVG